MRSGFRKQVKSMKKVLCLLLIMGMLFTVGCKKQAKNIAKDYLFNKAVDVVVDNANKGSNTNGAVKNSPDSASSNTPSKSAKGKAGAAAAVAGGAVIAATNELEARANNSMQNERSAEQQYGNQDEPDWHWIKDNNTGVYIWNPEPEDGEYIVWNGDYVQVGKYRYANGPGIVTWYKNGKVIQVDNGAFERGRHHGKFTHKFPSGKVKYSNWDHGKEI